MKVGCDKGFVSHYPNPITVCFMSLDRQGIQEAAADRRCRGGFNAHSLVGEKTSPGRLLARCQLRHPPIAGFGRPTKNALKGVPGAPKAINWLHRLLNTCLLSPLASCQAAGVRLCPTSQRFSRPVPETEPGSGRAEQGRAGQSRVEQGRAGQPIGGAFGHVEMLDLSQLEIDSGATVDDS